MKMNELPSRPGPRPSPGLARAPVSYPSKDISHTHKPTWTQSLCCLCHTEGSTCAHCSARCSHTCAGDGTGQGRASWLLPAQSRPLFGRAWLSSAHRPGGHLGVLPASSAPRVTLCPRHSVCAKAPLYDKVSKVRLMGERFQAFVSTTDISKLPSDTKTADCQAQGKVDECLLLPALADAVLRNAPTPASVTGGTDTSVLSLRFCIRRKAEHFFINSGPWIFPVL